MKSAITQGHQIQTTLKNLLNVFSSSNNQKEVCAAAEKIKFAWAQYRFKIEEAHDFVATNMDLYRSSFRIGRERSRNATNYVLAQMDSTQDYRDQNVPKEGTIGSLMLDVRRNLVPTENILLNSGCF